MMNVTIPTNIEIDPKTYIGQMHVSDVAELISAVAAKYDHQPAERLLLASVYGDNLTEAGARFLAEVIAQNVSARLEPGFAQIRVDCRLASAKSAPT